MKKIFNIIFITMLSLTLLSCQNNTSNSNSSTQSNDKQAVQKDDKQDRQQYLNSIKNIFGNTIDEYTKDIEGLKRGGNTVWVVKKEDANAKLNQINDMINKVNSVDTKQIKANEDIKIQSLDLLESMKNTINAKLVYTTEKDLDKITKVFNAETSQIKKNQEKIQKFKELKVE